MEFFDHGSTDGKNHSESYITCLTTESYIPGVKILYASLRRVSQKPLIVAVPTDSKIDGKQLGELEDMGITVRMLENYDLNELHLLEETKTHYWYNTIFKLKMFGLDEYEKLVFLDSDLLICENIDCLFDYCTDKPIGVSDYHFMEPLVPEAELRHGVNSGVVAFKPSGQLEHAMTEIIPTVCKKMLRWGDQDVINEYYNYEFEEFLPLKYNACFYGIGHYKNIDKPAVLHFILPDKPWMWSRARIVGKYIKYFLKGEFQKIKYLHMCMSIRNEVEKKHI